VDRALWGGGFELVEEGVGGPGDLCGVARGAGLVEARPGLVDALLALLARAVGGDDGLEGVHWPEDTGAGGGFKGRRAHDRVFAHWRGRGVQKVTR
jgi:hypothetical protein